MKYTFLNIFLFLSICTKILGQNPDDLIIPSSINIKFLEHLTKLEIDSVRKSYNLSTLINDPTLYDAACDHSKYLTLNNTLGHYQTENRNKKTPQNRIEYFGAKDISAGENVIQIFIFTNTVHKHDKKAQPHIISTYRQAAYDMMIGWINSPGHFANIITKEYSLTGLSIEFDSITNSIRAVQVFGKLIFPETHKYNKDIIRFPYETSNMDSLITLGSKFQNKFHKKHAWKLKNPSKKKDFDRCKACEQLIKDPDDFYSTIIDDSLFFFFANKSQLEQTFNKKKDGLALEIIPFKNYSCDNNIFYTIPSRRNNLCIFNGKVTPPVYKKDFEKRIRHEKEWKNNVLVNMGLLPDSIKDGIFDINLLLIKKKKICNIVRMSGLCGELFNYVPSKFPYNVNFKNKNTLPRVKQDTVNLTVYFEKNKWDYDVSQIEPALNILKDNNYEVLKAMLNSFASVEGTEELNENLYNNRAKAIISRFEEKQDSVIPMKITMQENWPLFFKQIKGTRWEQFGTMDTLEIRKQINNPQTSLELESLLKKQRFTYVRLIARYKITEQNIDSLLYKEFFETMDKLNKKFQKVSPLNLNNESKRDIARLEEIELCLLSRNLSGKLKDTSILFIDIPLNPAFAGLLFYRTFYKFTKSNLSEEDYFNDLSELIETKTKNANVNYHYIAYLINNIHNNSYRNLLNSDYIKYFIDILSAENYEKERLNELQLLYHFYICKESLFSSKIKNVKSSLSYIFNYYNSNSFSDSILYSVASHMIVFKKYDYARKLLEPLVNRPAPDINSYKLFLHLVYSGQITTNNSDYYNDIINSADIIPTDEWCGLFLDNCRITFQLMDFEPLRNLFCIKCGDYIK